MDVCNVRVLNSPCQEFFGFGVFFITTFMQMCIFSDNKAYEV